jgi:hypothetical protein
MIRNLHWNNRAENRTPVVKIYYITKALQRDSTRPPRTGQCEHSPRAVVTTKTLQNSRDKSTYGLSLLFFCCQVR